MIAHELLGVLGSGSYGRVYKIMDRFTKQVKAVKFVGEKYPPPLELGILTQFHHPYLLHAESIVHEKSDGVGIVTPMYSYDLHNWIEQFQNSREVRLAMSTEQSIDFAFKLVCAAKFLFDNRILHLDFKPQNILLDYNPETYTWTPVICDFGMCLHMPTGSTLRANTDQLVTLPLRPVELVKRTSLELGEHTIVWQLGMTLQYLFGHTYITTRGGVAGAAHCLDVNYGSQRAREQSLRNTLLNAKNEEPVLTHMVDLLSKMFHPDIAERIRFDTILAHPLFTLGNETSIAKPPLGTVIACSMPCVEHKHLPAAMRLLFDKLSTLKEIHTYPSMIVFHAITLLQTVFTEMPTNENHLNIYVAACLWLAWKTQDNFGEEDVSVGTICAEREESLVEDLIQKIQVKLRGQLLPPCDHQAWTATLPILSKIKLDTDVASVLEAIK